MIKVSSFKFRVLFLISHFLFLISATAVAQEPRPVPADQRTMELLWQPRDLRYDDGRIGMMKDRKTKLMRHWVLQPGDSIVFYVDTLIEQPWRDAVKRGIRRWNVAFREAGLGDVVRSYDYPSEGWFDPDTREYNVVRFINNPSRENAQGVFWFDPRSGEIGRGEIYWWSGVVNKLKLWLYAQTAGAWEATRGSIPDSLMVDAVEYAAAHEMGHVLGLQHNMRGSYAIPTDSLRSPSFTQHYGTTASVMDYARNNYVAQPGDPERGVRMMPPVLGEYDKFAIQYLYGGHDSAWIHRYDDDPMTQFVGTIITAKPTDPTAQPDMLGDDLHKTVWYSQQNFDRILAHPEWRPSDLDSAEVTNYIHKFSDKLRYLAQADGDINESVVGLATADFPFKPFATATFIDGEGLVLSAYHPLIRYIERISDEQHNFPQYGYWSQGREEETRLFNLCVTQLVGSYDVTQQMNRGAKGRDLIKKYAHGDKTLEGNLVQLTDGKTVILNMYRVYRDVRLVAAPSESQGKFGGEDDNWQWPRTTFDCALVRVYADASGRPAEYSKDNVPLTGNVFLPLAQQSAVAGDSVRVVGYPARTKWYVPSFALEYMRDHEIPNQILLDSLKIDIIERGIAARPEARFSYSSTLASLWNDLLKQRGLLHGLQHTDVIAQRKSQEDSLLRWMEPQASLYDTLRSYKTGDQFFQEACISGAEVIPFAGKFEKMVQMFHRKRLNMKAIQREAKRLQPLADQFFRHWDRDINREMLAAMLSAYISNVPSAFRSKEMIDAARQYGGDMQAWADSVITVSILTHQDSLNAFLAQVDTVTIKTLTQDPLYQMALSCYAVYIDRINQRLTQLYKRQAELYQDYLAALDAQKGPLTPDCNRMQRTYNGKILERTTFQDHITKADAHKGDPRYALRRETSKHKDVPLNFLATCFTTGGNSGSPILNKEGEIVGLNFDRTAESIVSEYEPTPTAARNICVDVSAIRWLLARYLTR